MVCGINNNNNVNNNNRNDNKSNISFITDPILAKLLMEGLWDKTTITTKTTKLSLSSTTPKQKQQQQQIYLRYYWPNFDSIEINLV